MQSPRISILLIERVIQTHERAGQGQHLHALAAGRKRSHTVRPKICLIEDNDQNRFMTTFLLEKHGCEVVPAVDGPTGIALAAKVRPCVILPDIQLPPMDGHAVARAPRLNRELDRIPIVAVTSCAMMGDREKALEAGCDGIMEEPINPVPFVADIERRLGPPGDGTNP